MKFNPITLLNGGNGGEIAIGKLAQPLEAGTDLNEISAAGSYNIPFDPAIKPDYTAILFVDTEAEAIIKLVEYMRAEGYIVETPEAGSIVIKSRTARGANNDL